MSDGLSHATDRNGTIYEGGFGSRVLGDPAEMTLDTVVWIASMTKALTGTAAMQLVEQGKLTLDTPASDVLLQLGEAVVLEGFDAGGQPRTRAPRRPITLRHLLKLGTYLSENVFGPLEMNDTAFRITPAMRQRLARVHQRRAGEALVPIDFEVPQDPEFEMGGGGLYGTVGDYLKFVRMMLNHGSAASEQVLKPETVELMSRNAMDNCKVTMLHTVSPAVSHDAEFFPDMPKEWGLTFMINHKQAPTGRSAGSLAWAGLANTYYWIDLARSLGGVYARQILPFADHKAPPLFFEFEKTIYHHL